MTVGRRLSRGMSLITVLVALTIAALLAFFVGSYLNNNFKSQLHVEQVLDVQQLGIFVLRRLNCSATFPTQLSACVAGQGLAVASNDPTNPILIKPVPPQTTVDKDQYTSVGKLSLRARCVADPSGTSTYNKKLLIEYAVIGPNASFSKDPLTRQPLSWKDLFDGLPTPCIVM